MGCPAVSSAKRPRENAIASSSGLRGGKADTIHPAGLSAGSLSSGVLPLDVVICTGTALVPAPGRASSTFPEALSQDSQVAAPPPGWAKVARDCPPLIDHSQVPGVCGESRQSTGAAGRGGGGAGLGRGAGAGAGGGTFGATQLLSAMAAPRMTSVREIERIAFTALLWKEPRR